MAVAAIDIKWATFIIHQWREFSIKISLGGILGTQLGRQEQGEKNHSA